MSEEIVLEAKSISKFFGTITALNDVNLKITKGSRRLYGAASSSGRRARHPGSISEHVLSVA